MKEFLRRLPGLVTANRRARLLWRVFYEGWWLDQAHLYEELHRTHHWDFESEITKERNRTILAAVAARRGCGDWGDVLELGCAEGVFTLELARRSRSVTAYDISPLACARARQRCASLGNVRIEPLDLARAPLAGSYDIAFAVDLFDELHGRGRIGRVAAKLANAVRPGGLLVFSGCRLPHGMREDRLARWFHEGADSIVLYFDKRFGFNLLRVEPHPAPGQSTPGYLDHLIAVFEKSSGPRVDTEGWKRFVPARMRSVYRTTRLALRLLPWLDFTSPQSLRDSAGLLLAILKVKPDTLLDICALQQLHRLTRVVDQEGVAGDFVECGVYQGGSAAVLGYTLRQMSGPRHLWLFDSFQGLPPPTAVDGARAQSRAGTLAAEEGHVQQLLHRVRAPEERVHIVPGWFQETFPRAGVDKVALLHIDADWYQSVKLCLEHFYDRLAPGAIVVLDDYGVWPGCEAAYHDFLRERGLNLELKREGLTPPYFRKPGG